ncbi:hypothetical protein FA09DRAFT_332773 [Tilletiopsis washingtonensis]|uniref:Uncharacterized protein n=1 Tax=Tilletiopsis washingtonensis TaxID=58919 RepID=A0A316YZL4_9BASI|nr:hypothetical protein FA09DRAFT_332773 [Tilletiopsis washingtonensis]PWN94651.1 hypothetical protein FA09DRAFT_332773 [Tilletiopsis washingtonensis]
MNAFALLPCHAARRAASVVVWRSDGSAVHPLMPHPTKPRAARCKRPALARDSGVHPEPAAWRRRHAGAERGQASLKLNAEARKARDASLLPQGTEAAHLCSMRRTSGGL